MTGILVVLGALLGGSIGSFVNMARWRVPRHESIVRPPSHCDACSRELDARDLVPVLSWIWLRGRCRTCSARIGASSLVIEATGALIGGLVAFLLVS